MRKSLVRRQLSVNHSLPDSLHPVLKRIYAARNIASARELDYSLQRLLPHQGLSGIESAVVLLADALAGKKRLLVVSDYDVDGATSCALAIRGLRRMGASEINYIVPSRFEFGYGLTPELVEVAAEQQPDILITVDNGISSLEGVRLARDKGIKVLITDHHLPGAQLPDANAIVNPNLDGDAFVSKSLAGVGVMFYLLIALRAHLREQGWFGAQNLEQPNLAELLDLVALGTVADVVALDHNNRILVSQGLARIRAGRCIPGIRALIQVAKRSMDNISATDLGFAIGPRLNAAGRLSDMSLGIECLLTDDDGQALNMAMTLDGLNKERREIQSQMQELADFDLLDLDQAADDLPLGLCLFRTEWHQGVIGILASRIKEQWQRPVITFSRDRDGVLKGSARSINGVHIRDILENISVKDPGLIIKFGGHAMAAGLTILEADFERFRAVFESEMARMITKDDLASTILTDGDLGEADLNLSLAEAITQGGPWGQAFPEPLFDGMFKIADRRIVGENHLKMTLKGPDSNHGYDAIAFNTLDDDWPEGVEYVQLAYRLDVNEFRGRRSLQFIVEHVEPVIGLSPQVIKIS